MLSREREKVPSLSLVNMTYRNFRIAASQITALNSCITFAPSVRSAPTNEAFAALPTGTIDYLLQPENAEQLTNILKYHVVASNTVSGSLTSGDIETLSGDFLKVDATGEGSVMVNGAEVITPDIIANNGIIHAIGMVLIPPVSDAPTKNPTSGPKDSIYDMAAGSDVLTILGKSHCIITRYFAFLLCLCP